MLTPDLIRGPWRRFGYGSRIKSGMTKDVSERQLPAPKLPFSTSSLDLVIVKRRPAMSWNGSEGNGMGLRIFALALAAAAPSTAFAAPIAPSCPAAPVLPPDLAGR